MYAYLTYSYAVEILGTKLFAVKLYLCANSVKYLWLLYRTIERTKVKCSITTDVKYNFLLKYS